jgi:hypothetical protein
VIIDQICTINGSAWLYRLLGLSINAYQNDKVSYPYFSFHMWYLSINHCQLNEKLNILIFDYSNIIVIW